MFGPRVVFAVLLAAAAAAVGACGKAGGTTVEVIAGKPAGVVREVAGTVTATRPGHPARTLKATDSVSGDDVIETGADGSVLIELDHNHVTLTLPAGKRQQVAASPAWGMPVAAARVGSTDEHSAAAGRAIERSAVDTASSSMEPTTAAPPLDLPDQAPQGGEQVEDETTRSRGPVNTGGKNESAKDRVNPPKPPDDTVEPKKVIPSDGIIAPSTGGSGGGGPRGDSANADLRDVGPKQRELESGAAPAFMIELATAGPLTTADAAAKITLADLATCLHAAQSLTVVISASGAISRVSAIDAATTTCVKQRLASITFAARKAATTITIKVAKKP